MWLTKSSVGRKVVMSVTGLFLVLFVTFHALMNAVAVVNLDWYDAICEFLGANWYAVLGTGVIALFVCLHIVFAFWLTLQNRKARGGDSYAVSKSWKEVDWASKKHACARHHRCVLHDLAPRAILGQDATSRAHGRRSEPRSILS